jgi:2-polyprenyl-3-methyl-5-hydroxy-6-metoxy-1,4-benzoquinol methylase
MKLWLLDLLICPHCDTDDPLTVFSEESLGDNVIEGTLSCPRCNRKYLIINGIPRFVEPEENYAENFGYQWHQFRITQIDRINAHNLSRSRLLNDTRWSIDWMQGKLILDAGCGAGRFTDELAQLGARVVACDISSAVDACKQTVDDSTGHTSNRGKVEIVQANLLAMPFKKDAFEAIHCAGVIQHTPDPDKIMRALPSHLQSNGRLFYNFYEVDPFTKFQVIKYLLRQWTPKWRMQTLVKFSRWMCYIFFVPSFVMNSIPVVRFFNRFLPICSVHPRGVPVKQQFNLTLLDTVDWYGPQYEIRQNHKKVSTLLEEEGLDEVESAEGFVWAIKR